MTSAHRRDDTWLWALAGLALGVFGLGFVVRWQCLRGSCALGGNEWIVDIDAVGGLPRLFTTSLFLATTACAVRIALRSPGPARLWWSAVAALGAGLVVAKLVSAHSVLERWDGVGTTLLAGAAGSVVGLPLLWLAGRSWRVPRSAAVVGALTVYALAALGLDVVTGLVATAEPFPLPMAAATFVEELGEALSALFLLATVVRSLRPRR